MSFEIINPESLGRPRGWSNGIVAPPGGRLLFIAGQTARGADGVVAPAGFVDQFARSLDNVLAVLRQADGAPEQIARMTVYVTDVPSYRASLAQLGEVWRKRMGRHYPAMALLGVAELVDPEACVEIEATAVLPDTAPIQSEPRPQRV